MAMSDLQLTLDQFAGHLLNVLVTSPVGGGQIQEMNGGIEWKECGFICPFKITILNQTIG